MKGDSNALDEIMDLGLGDNEDLGEVFVSEDHFDDNSIGNEKCGICMDVVVDKGVLDCCNHWFCFPCIDNWATITNLCPFCKKEFQLITCVPVYDALGNFKVDEHSFLREDDWCSEEENSMLSFPSYYINEDAVNCLDGDSCKVRNGMTEAQNLNLDTSIACDSCDMWYHAFCVGFDPERAMGTSWLCPRCIANRMPDQYHQRNVDYRDSISSSLTDNMSISVADAGETAVVVSLVDKMPPIEAGLNQPESLFEEPVGKTEESPGFTFNNMSMSRERTHDDALVPIVKPSSCNYIEIEDRSNISADLPSRTGVRTAADAISSNDGIMKQSDCVTEKAVSPSGSQDLLFVSLSDSFALDGDDSKQKISKSRSSDEQKVSTYALTNDSSVESVPSGRSVPDLRLVPQVSSSSSGRNAIMERDANDEMVSVDHTIREAVADETVVGEGMKTVAGENITKTVDTNGANGIKQKSGLQETDSIAIERTMKRGRESEAENKTEICIKKPKSCASTSIVPLMCQRSNSFANSSQGNYEQTTHKGNKLMNTHGKENIALDIMGIVQERCHRSADEPGATLSADKIKNKSGVRVKKIIRVAENNESSILVQKLRKEIQEVVHDNPSKNFGKDSAFDGKLLAAFRAAMAGPRHGLVNKVKPSLLRTKRSLLQSGKSREKLTKKIYGTANGRRRRAWDRDREIEFWKHRCLRSKVEKVETLQSVLDLLKSISSADSMHTMEGPEDDSKNSIMSRVYLADASVFPRSEDIQPLSALVGTPTTSNILSKDKECKLGGSPGKRSQNLRIKGESSCQHRTDLAQEVRISVSSLSKQKKSAIHSGESSHQVPSNDTDKRRWALEVLARKSALTDGGSSQGSEDDNTMLKRNHPLLAQLPVDMKPVVAPSHHNKVSLSVRQAQLYRLSEFYLRQTNLSVISRTAATELAIADAINVEKEIFERSNSKLVYMNLCSQHVTNCKLQTAEKAKSHHPEKPVEEIKMIAGAAGVSTEETCDITEEALKMTGLWSDSPLNSPDRSTESPIMKDAFPVKNYENNHNVNILYSDSNAEHDIHRDFAYDLKDEGLVSSREPRASMLNLQSEDVNLKVKVALSGSDKLYNDLKSEDRQMKATAVDEQVSAALLDNSKVSDVPLVCQKEGTIYNMGLNTLTDCHGLVVPSSAENNYKEPSLVDCEEQCGPNKELMVEKFTVKQTSDAVGNLDKSDLSKNEVIEIGFLKEKCAENNLTERRSVNHENFERENSSTHSEMNENVPRKEINTQSKVNDIPDSRTCVSLKVEAYIKEHIRPLCKSQVITAEQYRWAVGKTRDKVMSHHCRAKNANFLIKEGDKVKKLAEQYVEMAQHTNQRSAEIKKSNG